MKPSKYYQRWLQIVSRSSDVLLFFCAFFLGKEAFAIAIGLLIFRLINGYVISKLIYKRLQATISEGGNHGCKNCSDRNSRCGKNHSD